MASGSKVTSKVAGKAKGAAKALQGYSGIFHHLAGEHAEVSTMMKQVAGTMDAQERQKLFPEIRRSLLAHAKGEEQEFYPVLREIRGLQSHVERSLEEHREIESLLERLNQGDKSTKDWTDSFERLMSSVEQHVKHEEQEIFPRANEAIESKRAKEMERRYETAEEREKETL